MDEQVNIYTFEGKIQTLTFFSKGKVEGLGKNLEEARENAIRKLCKTHNLGRNCISVEECVSVR